MMFPISRKQQKQYDYNFNNSTFNKEDSKILKKSDEINFFDVYKIILDTRKFEIENFWKRATFFWGTLAILFVAYYSIKIDIRYLSIVSLTGLIYSLIFSLSIRGSKYWQEHWELLAKKYEKKLNDILIFRWKLFDEINKENKDTLSILKPYRISVSKLVMIISDFLTLSWLSLFLKDIIYLYRISDFNNPFNFETATHFSLLFIALLFIFSIMLVYIAAFIGKTNKENKKKAKESEKA